MINGSIDVIVINMPNARFQAVGGSSCRLLFGMMPSMSVKLIFVVLRGSFFPPDAPTLVVGGIFCSVYDTTLSLIYTVFTRSSHDPSPLPTVSGVLRERTYIRMISSVIRPPKVSHF